MHASLERFEDNWSTGVSDALVYLGEEPPLPFGFLLTGLLLVAAGLFTLIYLTIKLFIPERYK